jgi:hypothetical protein
MLHYFARILDKGTTPAEYVTERLQPMVERDYQAVARKIAAPITKRRKAKLEAG